MDYCANPNASAKAEAYPAASRNVISLAAHRACQERLRTWPEFAETPLVSLPHVARACGVAEVFAKVEGGRCGLGSFKALGGALAVDVLAASRAANTDDAGDDTTAVDMTVSTASAGNHGMAVAWGAARLNMRCVVYLHAGVGEAIEARMQATGAETRRVAGNYDDSVAACRDESRENGWQVVQDTSAEGYEDIPKQIWQVRARLVVVRGVDGVGRGVGERGHLLCGSVTSVVVREHGCVRERQWV